MRPEERGADNRRVLFRIVSDESHPSQRIVRIDVQRMGRGTQAGDAVNVVVETARVADGGETLLSVHAHDVRELQRGGAGLFENLDLELAICEIVPGELRMGVDRGAVARFPAHHDGFPVGVGAPSEVGAQVRFVRKAVEGIEGVGGEPPLDLGFDPGGKRLVDRGVCTETE